jgi:hypothetical protein
LRPYAREPMIASPGRYLTTNSYRADADKCPQALIMMQRLLSENQSFTSVTAVKPILVRQRLSGFLSNR